MRLVSALARGSQTNSLRLASRRTSQGLSLIELIPHASRLRLGVEEASRGDAHEVALHGTASFLSLPKLLTMLGMLMFLGVMDLWKDAMTTMALMLAATITAIIVSIPVGVWMSRSLNVRKIITPVLDLTYTTKN